MCVAIVEFIPFVLDEIRRHLHVKCNRGLAGNALRIIIHSRMRYDLGRVDGGNAFVYSLLHFLNSIPEHCRTDSEKAKIKSLFSWFEKENLAGNIGGEKCGLSEMWVFPPKKGAAHSYIPSQENQNHSESMKTL